MLQSALLAPFPAVDPLVAQWRDAYDQAAPDGIPAHITLLYPFMAPDAIDEAVDATLTACFAGVAPFTCTLGRVGWFGDTVVYLEPVYPAPFVALTAALVAAFPAYPPYEGQFDAVVPHLTLGDTGTPAELQAVAAQAEALVPHTEPIDRIWLMTGELGSPWSLHREWLLG